MIGTGGQAWNHLLHIDREAEEFATNTLQDREMLEAYYLERYGPADTDYDHDEYEDDSEEDDDKHEQCPYHLVVLVSQKPHIAPTGEGWEIVDEERMAEMELKCWKAQSILQN